MLKLKELVESFQISDDKIDHIFEVLATRYHRGRDPWGLDLAKMKTYLKLIYPLYKNYFKVRVFGTENIDERNFIFLSNHSGQIALDGLLICTAMVLELDNPRVLRGMIERWMAGLPFISKFSSSAGSILGDRKNCLYLLEKGESILVFPEGVSGVSKNTNQFYQLQKFTTGFFRMAITGKCSILPVCIIGAEEFYPIVYHPRKLAKLLKLPALPIAPSYLFGPLGFVPLPSPIDIYFGKPYELPNTLNPNASDKEIEIHVSQIKSELAKMIGHGLKNRRPFWGEQLATTVKDFFK